MYVIKYLNIIQKGYSLMLGGVLVLVAVSIVRSVEQLLNLKDIVINASVVGILPSSRPAPPKCAQKSSPTSLHFLK